MPSSARGAGTDARATSSATTIDRMLPRAFRDGERRGSVRERIEDDVYADGVALRRELQEKPVVLTFPLPRVTDIGVVGHENHDAAFVVRDRAEVGVGAVRPALPRFAAGPPPGVDVRALRELGQREHRVTDRVPGRHVEDAVAWQYAVNLT